MCIRDRYPYGYSYLSPSLPILPPMRGRLFGGLPERGDIVLCHPVIRREARAQGKPLGAHYAHLVVHGLLHLCGYDHQRPREAERMERAEARLLARAGFADPYAVE